MGMASEDDPLKAASRALADAAATLGRVLGAQASKHLPEVKDAVAESLREAARDLADATDSFARSADATDDRRRRKVDRTRADLLDAAERVFSAKGFEGASVDDVATEAGYTKGAVYAHFGSKRDLFLAVARARLDVTTDPEAHRIPGVGDQDVRVEDVDTALRALAEDPRLLLSLELLAYALRHPDDAADLPELYGRAFEAVVEHVASVRRARATAAGDTPEPGVVEADRDAALGVVAVLNVAPLGARLLPGHVSTASGARVVARLLS